MWVVVLRRLKQNQKDLLIGEAIEKRRFYLGLTIRQIAQAAGFCTYQQLYRYEKGINKISASALWAIAEILKVDIDDLFIATRSETNKNTEQERILHADAAEFVNVCISLDLKKRKTILAIMESIAARSSTSSEP